MDKNIGKILDDRYELLELIGVGGMADIYKARDTVEDKIVAAKILKNELAESEDFLRRFRNESKAIALLSHPNIVKIFDVGFSDKVQFIVMEYIDGITLTEYIESQGVLKWRDALHFINQILRALQHAHDRGIVHRDIKSQNVMLLPDGTIKVMDFGIARFNRETDKTISEKAIGSVHYISPEQARGDATDEKSDIYSVGVMLFEMLTGRKPFDGDNPVSIALMHMQTTPKKPTDINSSIPDGLEEITLKAMQKEPDKRYQTAGEMITDIDEFKKNPSIIFEYKYFSAENSTKYFGKEEKSSSTAPIPETPGFAAKKDTAANFTPSANYINDEDDDDYDDDIYDEVIERRSPLLSILFATASVFVIMAAWLIFTIVTDTFDPDGGAAGGGREIKMPYLHREDYRDVIAMYPELNLSIDQEFSSEYPENQIMRQSVPAGRNIRVGQQIDIVVSKGPNVIELNNYEGGVLHVDEVKARIIRQGFEAPNIRNEESSTVPSGYVIRTDPPAGAMIEADTKITVFVSFGSGGETTAMPELQNLTKSMAEERAKMYNIVLIFNEEYSETIPEGRIIDQEYPPATVLDNNTPVEVTVSLGKRPDRSGKIEYTAQANRKGDYILEHYIDGDLQAHLTKIQNIELNKKILWEFEGSGIQNYAIYFTSVETERRAKFCEWEFDFTGDSVKSKEIDVNRQIFAELSKPLKTEPDEPDEPDEPNEPEEQDEPGDTDDTQLYEG